MKINETICHWVNGSPNTTAEKMTAGMNTSEIAHQAGESGPIFNAVFRNIIPRYCVTPIMTTKMSRSGENVANSVVPRIPNRTTPQTEQNAAF